MTTQTSPPEASGQSDLQRVLARICRQIDEFVRKVANGHLSEAEGEQLVREQAAAENDAEFGDQLASESAAIAQQEEHCADLKEEHDEVRRRRQKTPERERASSKHGRRETEATEEIKFPDWSGLDQANFCGCLGLSAVMLGAGAANIQGNLVASGLPLFTLNPVFAWLFAMLAPAAALAIHSFGASFETYEARQRFKMSVFSATGVAVLGWSWLFADLFHGTGGLDLSFEESGLKDTLFVWLQVAAEILVGASLFLIAEDIAAKYSPNTWVQNQEHIELLARETRLFEALQLAYAQLNALRGKHAKSMAARETVINRAVAEYHERLKRFGEG
jgi:hypothetical protein